MATVPVRTDLIIARAVIRRGVSLYAQIVAEKESGLISRKSTVPFASKRPATLEMECSMQCRPTFAVSSRERVNDSLIYLHLMVYKI